MMNRRNQILIGALVLQLVLVAAVFWPRQAPAAATGQPLFPGVTADLITSVSLTDAQGSTIRLAKIGVGWVLPDAGDYPAVTDNVTSLLDKIAGLTAERLITQTKDSHKRLKVAEDDFNARIEFDLSDGSQHRLYLGNSAGYAATHVRADDQEQVYLASSLSSSDASSRATAWIDASYFSVTREEVVAMTLANATGTLEFVKDQAGTWTMTGLALGETLNQSAVTSLLTSVSNVSMQRPLGKEQLAAYGLETPAAVVTLQIQSEAEGQKNYTLRVGAEEAADQGYVLKASSSPYYVLVSSYTGNNWIEKVRDDFLEVPPTATPAP
jgi:hypothetical protein